VEFHTSHVNRKIKLFLKILTVASPLKHPRNTIGPAVRRFRLELDWSQSDLATHCQLSGWNISRDIVAAIEGRVRWVGDFEIMVIAHVLKIPVISLFPDQINWVEFTQLTLSSQRHYE